MDEATARAILGSMYEQIVKGPHAALGVDAAASADDVHAAFRELAKTFHPAKFARMSDDIRDTANEVFLKLREMHDGLMKSAKARPPVAIPANGRPPAARPPSGPQPLVNPTRTTGAVPPLARPPAASQSLPRGVVPGTAPRGLTPAQGVRITGAIPQRSGLKPSGAIPNLRADAEIAAALEAVGRAAWDEAIQAFDALAQMGPHLRAAGHYVRGLKAASAGDRNAAQDEYNRASDADAEFNPLADAAVFDLRGRKKPDPLAAKTALAELFGRRK